MPASTGILCPIHRDNLDRRHQSRRFATETSLGIPQTDHVVLVTFGGIRSENRVQLPNIANVHWIALAWMARGNVPM